MILDPSDDRDRFEREMRRHKRLQDLLLRFSREAASGLGLNVALGALTPEIRDMFGAESVEIWLHDRQNRELVLSGAGSGTRRPGGDRVPAARTAHYAANGLRLDRAKLRGSRLIAPLRGWRRALGTLVIDREPALARKSAFAEDGFLDFAGELARQVSVGIENVQLLDEIRRQRRLLEDTFNSLVDLVAVMDQDLRIVQTNEAFAARVGLKRDDVMQRPLAELVGPDTLAYVEAADTWQGIVPAVQRRVEDEELDGTFLLTATPLRGQDGETLGRVLVAQDITRQTRLETERAALRERLAQSEKLASLGQFVAGIAHEMNNPLQGVLGHLELLIGVNEAARPVKRELKQIFQEAERAAKIVHNLLAFAGSHQVAREKVQVERLLTRAIASRKAQLKQAGIKVVRSYAQKVPPVMCDIEHLEQAVLNILINAEHAIAERGRSGRIEVTTGVRRSDKNVIVTIRDSGPGIAPDVLQRIFDPFFTTKTVGRGTGLGLAITYGIIQEHGGTITAGNARNGGAVFRIELPSAR